MLRFKDDRVRTDVGTGKCLHCLFRRNCGLSPSACAFLDGGLPVRKLAFVVFDTLKRERIYEYDCGWVSENGELNDTAVMPDEIDVMMGPGRTAWAITPFSLGRSPFRAVPRRGETREAFDRRVSAVVEKVRTMDDHGKPLTRLRRLFTKLGKDGELHDNYCDDVMFMAGDYWPGMSPEEILAMYTSSGCDVTPREYLSNRRRLEAANE